MITIPIGRFISIFYFTKYPYVFIIIIQTTSLCTIECRIKQNKNITKVRATFLFRFFQMPKSTKTINHALLKLKKERNY